MTVTKTRFTGLLLSPARNRGLAFTQLRAGSLRQSGPFWRNLVVQKNERITPNVTTARRTNPQRFISRLGPFFSPIQSSNQAVSFHLKYTPQTRVSHNFSQDRRVSDGTHERLLSSFTGGLEEGHEFGVETPLIDFVDDRGVVLAVSQKPGFSDVHQ